MQSFSALKKEAMTHINRVPYPIDRAIWEYDDIFKTDIHLGSTITKFLSAQAENSSTRSTWIDAKCGIGRALSEHAIYNKKNNTEHIGVDIEPRFDPKYRLTKPPYHFICGDLSTVQIPYKADLITMLDLSNKAGHVPSQLYNLLQHLKPSGKLLFVYEPTLTPDVKDYIEKFRDPQYSKKGPFIDMRDVPKGEQPIYNISFKALR